MAKIRRVERPKIGKPRSRPALSVEEYETRLALAQQSIERAGIDMLVVYADREHAGHLSFLTGFDPRFEEAIFLLDTHGRRRLLVGNECWYFQPDPRLGIDGELFQELSPQGQPRDKQKPLRTVLTSFGLDAGSRVGCAGWKSLSAPSVEDPEHSFEIPSFVVDALREVVGSSGEVLNVNGLFTDPASGLRVTSSADQIAVFEYAAVQASEGVKRALGIIKPGVAETRLERTLDNDGIPLSCHTMVSFGEKARRGLSSPSDLCARLGDAFVIAYGLQGGLTCRAGMVASAPRDVDRHTRAFFDGFVRNYFDVVSCWYETVRVGVTAGEVWSAVERVRDPSLYRFLVNPGHYLHLEEWSVSPFAKGNGTRLRSGMVMQLDIIPMSQGPFCYANIEDGVVLANPELRSELEASHRGLWRRVLARRSFLEQQLGIRLHESVLPLSNIPGWLPPYVLDRDRALTR